MDIKYKIIKERRKSLKLFIKDGAVIIKAPSFINRETIDNFVKKHLFWIKINLENYEKNRKIFKEGEKFLFFGKEYPLLIKKGVKKVVFDNAFYIDNENFDKENLIDFYKKEAKEYIEKRVIYFAKNFNLSFNNIKINSAQKRWGSCSSKNNLNFSYRLIMCPKEVIDYVIIHELSHLTHFNHSKDFWTLVSKRCPNYKYCEKWLFENYLKTIF
ncbi:M48 family metallopeptidase [Nitrosophilus kaiyonis]|uniref:M48 family metallopeptidase n=1 Tax=Nitrosophilus kaiyonis TaxID=2930200 RepID=UPI002493C617|nr:SprT family zinc-dependent metalloprotease [Nitrosophilus kaiyonis]